MDALINALKGHALGLDAQHPGHRWGIVQSVDASGPRIVARVTVQPEGLLSGWLPISQVAAGNGWGVVHVPLPGTMARLEPEDGGDAANLVITGFAHNDTLPAPQPVPYGGGSAAPLQPGDTALVSPSGGYIHLRDGAVIESKGTWKHTGDILASGEITDLNGVHGSLDLLREDYNQHLHTGVQSGAGTTGPTTKPTP